MKRIMAVIILVVSFSQSAMALPDNFETMVDEAIKRSDQEFWKHREEKRQKVCVYLRSELEEVRNLVEEAKEIGQDCEVFMVGVASGIRGVYLHLCQSE